MSSIYTIACIDHGNGWMENNCGRGTAFKGLTKVMQTQKRGTSRNSSDIVVNTCMQWNTKDKWLLQCTKLEWCIKYPTF